ncbi:MAG: hypothetical protein EPN84_00725 [Legionella sp.]|nr:MAG: hypothetical protein EPN84_00725 [Legionella sp.]
MDYLIEQYPGGLMFTLDDFKASRANKVTDNDREIYIRAAAMAKFVKNAGTIQYIKSTLIDKDSEAYTQFTGSGGGRLYSMLVFVNLITMVVLRENVFVAKNTENLKLIQEAATDLYSNPFFNRDANIRKILENLSKLIALDEQKKIPENSQPLKFKQAQTYCLSMYFALKMIYIYINKNNLGTVELNKTIDNQLLHIEQYFNILELEIQKSAPQQPSGEMQTIQSQLDARFLLDSQVLITGLKGSTLTVQLSHLQASIKENENQLSKLIETKKSIAALQRKINAYNNLLLAIEKNEQLVVGRQYILELIEANKENYEFFIANSSPRNQEFLEQLDRVQDPSAYEEMVANSLQLLSQGTGFLTTMYRKYTSTKVQNVFNKVLPSTLDSHCKTLLADLIRAEILEAALQKDSLENTLTEQEKTFAGKDLDPDLLGAESIENLELLLKEIKRTGQMAEEFQQLDVTLRARVCHTEKMIQDCQILADYIHTNDTFFIKVLTFLAKCLAIFRTEIVDLVEQAKDKKAILDHLIISEREQLDSIVEQEKNSQHPLIKEWFPACQQELTAVQQAVNPSTLSVKEIINNPYSLFSFKPELNASQANAAHTTIKAEV